MLRAPTTEKWMIESARKMNAYFMDNFRDALRLRGFICIEKTGSSPSEKGRDDRLKTFQAGVEMAQSCPKDHQIFLISTDGEYHIGTAENNEKLLVEIQHIWKQVSDNMAHPFFQESL